MHVIGFLGAEIAKPPCRFEYMLGFVHMNMNFRLAFRAGKYQRVAKLRQRFA